MADIHLLTPLTDISKITRLHQEALKRLKLYTIQDILNYYPTRHVDEADLISIENFKLGDVVTLLGQLKNVKVSKTWTTKMPITDATLSDISGEVALRFFNQAYIGKIYPEGTYVKVTGKVEEYKGKPIIHNPKIEKVDDVATFTQDSVFNVDGQVERPVAIYRESKNISSNYISTLVKRSIELGALNQVKDFIPEEILESLSLPSLSDAYKYIHFPKTKNHIEVARKRFAFQEIFLLQVKMQLERKLAGDNLAYNIHSPEAVKNFIDSFKWRPTGAQDHAIKTILDYMHHNHPMSVLLEGDVGSGKTFVAAVAALATISHNRNEINTPLQVAYMAPTEILAKQHFENFIKFFEGKNIEIALLTGSGCYKFPSKIDPTTYTDISRSQLLKWIKSGQISIVIGTHALFQKSVEFKDLALCIIDEQHRFGVKQRKALAHKKSDKRNEVPHLLSMTATPIPRTLALSIFGDLELVIIDELPLGRQPIDTVLISSNSARDKMYDDIRQRIENKEQVFVVVPRINEGENDSKLRDVYNEAKYLKEKIFPNANIDIIHSKLTSADKDKIMKKFSDGITDILISTTVVEVGVNVPNATTMIIEAAHRYGLAQLHQLRGRIGRGNKKSYCYLVCDTESENSLNRLKNLSKTNNGFELAELDLKERGAGSLLANNQSGMSDIAMEAIKNVKLVERAQIEARKVVDLGLDNYTDLKRIIEDLDKAHLE